MVASEAGYPPSEVLKPVKRRCTQLWIGKERIQCLQTHGLEDVAIGCLKAAQLAYGLFSADVTHVVNASGQNYPRHPSISYLDLPVEDSEEADISQHFDACSAFIDAARAEKVAGGIVLVHCQAGRSRSATLVAAWLIGQGWSCDDALAAVRLARPIAEPNSGFLQQLQVYRPISSSGLGSSCVPAQVVAVVAATQQVPATAWFVLDLTASTPLAAVVPELHEQWSWEGDESILPLKWACAVEECCGWTEALSGPLPEIWEDPSFDREGIFFLTYRSAVLGTAVSLSAGPGGCHGVVRFWGVAPGERRKGLGRCLLRLALARHRQLGKTRVYVPAGVNGSAEAAELLSQEGFQPSPTGPEDEDLGLCPRAEVLREMDLSQNRRLSDGTLARFLTTSLLGRSEIAPCIGPLKVLRLSNCSELGEHALEALSRIFSQSRAFEVLEEIDLSGVVVPSRSWQPLVQGLGSSSTLRHLGLAGTGCGSHSQRDCTSVASLLVGLRSLEVLDISGNHFSFLGCQAVSKNLGFATSALQELDLSHNTGFPARHQQMEESADADDHKHMEGKKPRFNPIMFVLEGLCSARLRRVTLASCQLSYGEDVILEDALQTSGITQLNVEDNPHGEQGLRCLVRILARGRKDRRVAAGFEDLRLGEIRRSGENLGCVSYSYADPTAAYSLKLDHPQHRSVLRLLLKRAEEVCGGGGKEFGCFQEETLDGKPASVQALCQKQRNSGGDTWLVPTSGTLNLTFKLALACNPKDGVDAAIRSHSRRMRIPVSLKSFSRLWQVYTSLPSRTSQELFLRAVSWDLSFKLPQVKILAGHSRELYAEAVTRLLGAIE
ncbi:unnamed protein product, partial [Polarella glacialis]